MVLATGGDDDAPRSDPVAAGPPPVTAGATDFGSGLSPGQYVTLDCDGAAPSGNSVSCTVMQAALPGRPLVAPRRSLVRAWAVRGATGRVGLQVLRATDAGFIAYNRGRSVTIDDPDSVTVVPADMSVPKGARFALELAPGSGVGVRRGVHAARTERFFGPVRLAPAKAAAAVDGEELLLRVDLVPRPAGAR
jgi:hypothetical protein